VRSAPPAPPPPAFAFARTSLTPLQHTTTPPKNKNQKAAGKRNDVSDSYAKALVELAEEKGALEQVHADVDAVAGLVKENAKLRELLFNPVVEGDKKKAVLAKVAKEAGFQKYTSNFLSLLVEKDRLGLLSEICESFEEQYCDLTDTQVATLRSAVKLEQEQQFLIAKKLQELTGSKNIKLKPVIDASLIAGFVVEYGSSQIDLSIRGQVERVAETLTKEMAVAV
jgi:F-type H+-transporting ATPase subunit delta